MRIGRLQPSSGAVIGVVALVFAVSGVAVAATKIGTDEIAKRAVTGSKIARDAVKSGKIADGKIKAQDLAEGVVPEVSQVPPAPEVPKQAYGRIDTFGNAVAAEGAVGITGVAKVAPGIVCYDLAFTPVSGTATPDYESPGGTSVEIYIGWSFNCRAPYNDAQTATYNPAAELDEDGGFPSTDSPLYVHFIG